MLKLKSYFIKDKNKVKKQKKISIKQNKNVIENKSKKVKN